MKHNLKNFTDLGIAVRGIAVRSCGSLPKFARDIGISYANLYTYCTTKAEFPIALFEKILEKYIPLEEEKEYLYILFYKSEKVGVRKHNFTFEQGEALYYFLKNIDKLNARQCALIYYVVKEK